MCTLPRLTRRVWILLGGAVGGIALACLVHLGGGSKPSTLVVLTTGLPFILAGITGVAKTTTA